MNTPDTVRANWLRTAFDKIVARELTAGGKEIDGAVLLAYAKDPRKQGRARRLALEVVEKLRPGTSEALYLTCLNDPEFRYEAVARVLDAGQAALKQKRAKDAEQQFRRAFAAARDPQQLRAAAAGLAQLGEFFLRIGDGTGQGIAMKIALPA